jgi:lysophospholipase
LAQAAPLVAIPGAPVPAGGEAAWFSGAGGVMLRAALFPATGEARGSVIVSPGRTEPIEKYFETVEALASRGFVVLVHDWRGQGLSYRGLADRTLGHANGYGEFLTDFTALLGAYETRLPKPWIALGHSMGGCLTLLALAAGETRFAAAILSAPMLGLRTAPVPVWLGREIARFMVSAGRGQQPARSSSPGPESFEGNIVTHDRLRHDRFQAQLAACPDLALGGLTWGWLDFASRAVRLLQKGTGVRAIAIPVVIVAAGADRVVDNAGARRVAARVPSARYMEIPGAYHEILQETDALLPAFWREFDALADRVTARD